MQETATLALDKIRQESSISSHALEIALENMPVGVSWAKLDTQEIIFTNYKFKEMFGYTANDFVNINDWIDRAYPCEADRSLAREKWGKHFRGSDPEESPVEPIELSVRCKSGEVKTVIVSGVVLPETGWILATHVDVSQRQRNEVLLQAAPREVLGSQALYRLIIDHSPLMMMISPLSFGHRYVSPGVEKLTGFTADEYLAAEELEFVHPDDRDRARAVLEKVSEEKLSHTFHYRALHKSGDYRWVEATITEYKEPGSDRIGGYITTVRDYTDQRAREDQLTAENLELSTAALRDELTGVANRRGFNRMLYKESLRQTRSRHDLSLLLLDVDCFKQYNDRYGHLAGDECLKAIACTAKRLLRRESDLIARFGGEEFVALLPMTDANGAEFLANRIRESVAALAIPHELSPYRVVTVSVGGSTWRAGEKFDSETLLLQADTTLYRAKKRGRNTICISGFMDGALRKRRNIPATESGERRRAAAV